LGRIKHPKIKGRIARFMPEYKVWRAIKNRCFNKNATDYKYYGGRGITVCGLW
jgi:hypothetical protein